MKNIKIVLFFLCLITVFVGCSTSILVTSKYDKKVDFTQFKTYCYHGWEENTDKFLTDSDKEFLEAAFTNEFNRRGLKPVTAEGDIIIGLYIHTEKHDDTTSATEGSPGNINSYGRDYNYGNGYGYGGYYGYGPGYGWGGNNSRPITTYDTYKITEGTLICDVYDAQGKKLIWESKGEEIIAEDPGVRQHTFALAVEKIMAEYPVPIVGAE